MDAQFLLLIVLALPASFAASLSTHYNNYDLTRIATIDKDVCKRVAQHINDDFVNMRKLYETQLKNYFQQLVPNPTDVFKDDSYMYMINGTDYNCHIIYETMRFLSGDVFPFATETEAELQYMWKMMLGVSQLSAYIGNCYQYFKCGPAPFDPQVLYHDRELFHADTVMAYLDTAFSHFTL
ncbi:hypothetical protein [Scale drop disease virus]|uniref:ORF_046L n=1 Tax=Scale drop disease virus TaxID=1697349 RepID=A0A0K1L668_9VIRU|nr:ORF_046L [Scale drop disease virus]AKU37461.1 ORF_046L [Scale drop disease virus]QLI60717.1 hypothetical protein [Scale drop disease virus]QXJ13635.1 ORF046L [Scale drop disease virus]UNH60739.1 hypothetical protein SDDV_ORF070 [Scale drop disease virus]